MIPTPEIKTPPHSKDYEMMVYHATADHLMIDPDELKRTIQMTVNLDQRRNDDELEVLNLEHLVLGLLWEPSNSHKVEGESIGEDDFLDDNNKKIFKAIQEAKKLKEVGDPFEKVKAILRKSGELEKICQETGDPQHLHKLYTYATPSTDAKYCFEIIRQRTIKRRLTTVSRDLVSDLANGKNPYEALDSVSKKIESIKANKPKADSAFRHLLDVALEDDLVKEIRKASPGVSVGFKVGDIDLKLPGGAITIVAGPTGHGKTMVLINFILNYLDLHPDQQAYFFSYEESRAAIQCLFLNTYINSKLSENNRDSIKSYFRDGTDQFISQESRKIFLDGKEKFFNELINTGRLMIFYSDDYTEELVHAIKFLRKNTNVGLVAIDYMQLLSLQNKKTISRQEELKQICLMLKDCAVNTGLPLLLAAQFNRDVDKQNELRATSIGEAGDIERVANMILGIWNKKHDDENTPAMYIKVLKGREIGIGHSSILDLNGNTGKLSTRSKSKGTW